MTSPTSVRSRPDGRYDPPSRVAARLLAVLLTVLLVALMAAIGNLIWSRAGGSDVEARVTRYAVLDDGDRVRLELEVSKPAGSPAYCVVRARTRDGVEVGRAVLDVDPAGTAQESVRLTHVLETTGRAATADVVGCRATPIPPPPSAP